MKIITQEQLDDWERELRSLLSDLKHGAISLIEFGKPEKITSAGIADIFTRIRIRATPSTYVMTFVHVFYGEHGALRTPQSKDPAHYPRNSVEGVTALIADAMAEVKHWTEAREKVGSKFLHDLNEGLMWDGREVDRGSASTGI